MQIMNPGRHERADPPVEDQGNKKRQKKMAWLSLSPLEKRRENEWRPGVDTGEVKVQIGFHYYWIQRIQGFPELCRLAVRRDSLILYEVLQHDILGISDDDLEDAVRLANGELYLSRDYPISDHIKRKLQILYAP
jgi:hypothetical protein